MKNVPGSEPYVADALSRAYLEETKESLIPDLEVNEVQLTAHLPISQERYNKFQQATAADPTLKALCTVVRNGWPCHKQELPLAVREDWSCRDEISEIDGLYSKHRSSLSLRVREKKC